MMLYEKSRVYEADDRELKGRDLMKYFRPLNDVPPAKAEELVAREQAVRAKSTRAASRKSA
jgi:hypothetical protein